MTPNQQFMNEAILLARKAMTLGEYPIGAVVVLDNAIIGSAYTSLDSLPDPTAHAEILALREAARHVGARKLPGAVLYTTLEPCPMCSSAAIWAHCSGLVFGATQEDAVDASERPDAKRKFRQILIKAAFVAERGRPHMHVVEGFLQAECVELLRMK